MKLISMFRSALAAVAVAIALPASAAFYVDDTTDGPTYQRALESFGGLSAVGTDVSYNVFSFSVSADGLYSVRSFAQGLFQDGPWDQFLFLYSGSFDPTQALSNGVIANDDFNDTIGKSGFDVALAINTAYYLVTAGYDNTDAGTFLNVITGPGMILPAIPEPGTYAMLAIGLFAVAFAVRRRSSDTRDS